MIIALHGAEFFAYHGFYPEEQKLGNWFVIDIDIAFTPRGDINNDELSNSVDYEKVYDMVCEEMKLTKKLIETVAQGILDKVKQAYAFVDSIDIQIKKLNPPLCGKVQYSSITINYNKA